MKNDKLLFILLILFVVCFSCFLSISRVDAATFSYSQFSFSSDAYFVNCLSADQCWNYVGESTNSVSSNSVGNIINSWSSPRVTTTSYGSGIGLSFDVSEGFISGNYYTVSILLESPGSIPTMYTVNSKLVGVGNSRQSAYNSAYYALDKNEIRNVIVDFYGTNQLSANFSLITYTFKASATGKYAYFNFTTKDTTTGSWNYYGYIYTSHGSQAPSAEEIKNALSGSFNQVNSNINNATNSINQNIDSMKEQQQETNNKLDEMNNADLDDKDKELPDDSKYQDYESSENDLKDKVNQADLSKLEIGIDEKSSLFVWDTMTRLIQSHSVVFGMFISILTVGIIKLALGR